MTAARDRDPPQQDRQFATGNLPAWPGTSSTAARVSRSTTTSSPWRAKDRPQSFIFIGAGVAIVFNNTVIGTTYNIRTIELRNERAWRDLPGFPKADGKNSPRRQSDSRRPARRRLSVLRTGRLGDERQRHLQAVALLCVEQHPQRQAAPDGNEPPCRRE